MKRAIRLLFVIALFLSVGASGENNSLEIPGGMSNLGLPDDFYIISCSSNTVHISMKNSCFIKYHLVDRAKKDLDKIARFILGSGRRVLVRFEVVHGNVNCVKRTDSCIKIIRKILRNGSNIEKISKGDESAPLADPFEDLVEFSLRQVKGAAVRHGQGL